MIGVLKEDKALHRYFISALRSTAVLVTSLMFAFSLPVLAQGQGGQNIDNLRKGVSFLSGRICGVAEPSDAAAKKIYDEEKQELADTATALIAALEQEKTALTGTDFNTTLSKQNIDAEETALKQSCPTLPSNLEKIVNAGAPAAGAGTQSVTVSPGTLDFDAQTIGTASAAKQVTVTNHTSGTPEALTVWYEDLPNYKVTDNTCNNVPVPNQGTCSFKVAFAPQNMDQKQGNIWIIPTSGWNQYQGLWGKYRDAAKAEDEILRSLESANKTVTAAAGNSKSVNKAAAENKTTSEENQTLGNPIFCSSAPGQALQKKDADLFNACTTLTNAQTKFSQAQSDRRNSLKAVQDQKYALRKQALAVIPLTGAPNHWKYPLTRAVVGLDLSAVSSQSVRQAYFVEFNLLAPFKLPGMKGNQDALENRWWFWLNPRITSLPKAANFSALSTISDSGSFFTNFSNTGSVSDIAQGFDVNGGVEMALLKPRDGIPWWAEYANTQARLGISLIGGGGIATPFSVDKTDVASQVNQSICDAFKAPAGATVSSGAGLVCTFPTGSNNPVIVAPNPAAAPGGAATVQDQFIDFFTPERSRFFRRYYGGFRLKTYFFSPDVKGECDPPNPKGCPAPYDIFPGIIDVTVGQDEAVTAGRLRNALLRVEGVYPLPFYPGLHIFGSIYSSFKRNQTDFPLNSFSVNQPANGASNDLNTFRFGTPPLNRDYFRVGIGIDLIQVFKRNQGGQPTTTTSTQSSQGTSGGTSAKTPSSGGSTAP